MKIKALHGKIIACATSLRDSSRLSLEDCVNIVRGKIDIPDEVFDDFCAEVGNPDLLFELTE